jgi:hypothetical protein
VATIYKTSPIGNQRNETIPVASKAQHRFFENGVLAKLVVKLKSRRSQEPAGFLFAWEAKN